jgi:putative transposase
MARKPRIESNENIYHVINRGNYRSFIFRTEGAKQSFETTLGEAAERSSWQVLAYCILSNHFHLCLATPKGNLSEGMRWLQATFATRFNRLRKKNGHLFQGRFKSLLVEPGEHVAGLVNYIHLNPLRSGLETAGTPGSYRWSSLHCFPKRRVRSKYLDCSWLNDLGIDDSSGGWARYKNRLRLRAEDDPEQIAKLEIAMNRGWCIGSSRFKQAVAADHLAQDGAARIDHAELKEFNILQWEHFLALALKTLRKSRADVAQSPFSAPWKLAIASRMRRETSVTNRWLSVHLGMGQPNSVSSISGLYRRTREKDCPIAKRLRRLRIEH